MATPSADQVKIMNDQSMIEIMGHSINVYGLIAGLMITLLIIALMRAHASKTIRFNWIDLVTSVDQPTGQIKASLTKILQMVGGATGTFIVIKLTLQNNINFDIFATYLAYVASIEGFSKFMLAKYGVMQQNGGKDPTEAPDQPKKQAPASSADGAGQKAPNDDN
jgi:uncharacterized membrane protein (Fun14 family)